MNASECFLARRGSVKYDRTNAYERYAVNLKSAPSSPFSLLIPSSSFLLPLSNGCSELMLMNDAGSELMPVDRPRSRVADGPAKEKQR